MDNELLKQALSECRGQQRKNAAEERRRLKEAAAACPEIALLEAERKGDILASLHSALDGAGVENIEGRTERRNRQIASLLERHGYDARFLDALYSCPLCRDTGYSGSPRKKLCACVIERYNALVNGRILSDQSQSFERYDDMVFPDSPLPGTDVTQRAYMRAVRARCEEYAEALPCAGVLNLLLYGGSGLGKTFLLRSIGVRAVQRGIATLACTSNTLLNRIRKAYFSRDAQDEEYYLNVPLLLIDDLGTEPLWENITIEQLFALVDERLDAGLHTAISTNLSLKELKSRYTERIMSRLMDERKCRILQFMGEDIRSRKG